MVISGLTLNRRVRREFLRSRFGLGLLRRGLGAEDGETDLLRCRRGVERSHDPIVSRAFDNSVLNRQTHMSMTATTGLLLLL